MTPPVLLRDAMSPPSLVVFGASRHPAFFLPFRLCLLPQSTCFPKIRDKVRIPLFPPLGESRLPGVPLPLPLFRRLRGRRRCGGRGTAAAGPQGDVVGVPSGERGDAPSDEGGDGGVEGGRDGGGDFGQVAAGGGAEARGGGGRIGVGRGGGSPGGCKNGCCRASKSGSLRASKSGRCRKLILFNDRKLRQWKSSFARSKGTDGAKEGAAGPGGRPSPQGRRIAPRPTERPCRPLLKS